MKHLPIYECQLMIFSMTEEDVEYDDTSKLIPGFGQTEVADEENMEKICMILCCSKTDKCEMRNAK